jgi:DNA-binding HxlR family transcriptional regulator
MRARRAIPPQLANCPVRNVLDRMSDRWSVLILRELGAVETMRFTVLKRAIGDISQRVLAQTLRRLEQDGYVSRTVFPTIPPRVDYALTPLGRSLWDCVTPLIAWAHANQKKVKAARTRYIPPPAQVAL